MKISEQDVEYVAKAGDAGNRRARKKALAEQLSRIVEYVDKLNELDLRESNRLRKS
jgi:Asp-tRNA(Asn)/Glu-tRNA(Gln) amidotransferase C subunit